MSGSASVPEPRGSQWWDGVFLGLIVPVVHAIGGFFTLDFLLSGRYTWGRTLKVLVLSLSLLVLAYEFVYRDLQARHPEWSPRRLLKRVALHTALPFAAGMTFLFLLLTVTRLMK